MSNSHCDYCDRPAVVHELIIKNGVEREIHLCEVHAQKAGIDIPSPQPINQMLSAEFVVTSSARSRRKRQLTCPDCGITFAQFRHSGVLGCPSCYAAFETRLSPLIERAQNGGTSHVGKTPARGGGSIDRQLLISKLKREMDHAVAAEQYERAAHLRDRLRRVEAGEEVCETDETSSEAGSETGHEAGSVD